MAWAIRNFAERKATMRRVMRDVLLECNFNSRLSIGYHEFTRLFSTFSYNTDYENPGVVLPVSK